jgi:uncharacterized protein (TIGR02466 family)
MQPINPWASLIYKDKYPGNIDNMLSVASSIVKNINDDHPLEDGGKSTWDTTLNILELPEFDHLYKWLIDKHAQVWNEWGFNDFPRFMHKSWINWHPPGATTLEHEHRAVSLVISMYLKQPTNGGNIQFKDPLQYHWSASPRQDTDNWRTIPIEAGDVLFFPGFLRHRTEPNTSNEDRFSLTVNVMAKYV